MTKDIIVNTALTILNEYEPDDLAIHRLTRHLGTATGATYWHYPSKQVLLGAVADRIPAPCTEFSVTGDWRADIEAVVELLYSCLTARRDGAEVISAALATGTATIHSEQLLADVLENAPETFINTTSAADTTFVLVHFILGATADRQIAAVFNLNRAKGASSKGDTGVENAVDKDAKVETSSKDTVAQAKELGHQCIALGTELFIAGISEAAEPTGVAGR